MAKRLFDVTVGALLVIAALPVIALSAAAVAVVFGSWPFFVHERVGLHGRRFRVPKLRTLPKDTPPYVDKYGLASMQLPRLGRFLRRTHLDELPQLLLVPLGKMSLVGPRPEMAYLHSRSDANFASERTSARPGCTGLWQIGPDAHRLIWEAPAYDLFYLHHHSLRLDAWILWRTVRFLAGRGRTVSLEELPRWAVVSRMEQPSVATSGVPVLEPSP